MIKVINTENGTEQLFNTMSEVTDGYHTFDELYYYRILYNAAFFNVLAKAMPTANVHKSTRHSDGELCFGGGWFVVCATLPSGQVTNHYKMEDWDLFKCEERETAEPWDGHTPQVAAERIKDFCLQ